MVFQEPSRKAKILSFLLYELCTLLIYIIVNPLSCTDFTDFFFFFLAFLGAVWNSWQVSVSFLKKLILSPGSLDTLKMSNLMYVVVFFFTY